MEEEIKDVVESHVEENLNDNTPTDEELSAAYDEFMGTAVTKVEEPVLEEEPIKTETEVNPDTNKEENKLDIMHQESSRLGRKVARIEEMIEKLVTNVVTKDQLDSLRTLPNITNADEEEIEDITDVNQLKSFMDKYISEREQKVNREREESSKSYQENYISSMKDLLVEIDSEDERRNIYNLMINDERFNVKLSNNSVLDAAKNFTRAQKEYLSKNKTRFDRDTKPVVPAGVTNVDGKQSIKKIVVPKLDKDAEELARSMNLSDEELVETLGNQMSPSLMRH